jgi:hypothetical protein
MKRCNPDKASVLEQATELLEPTERGRMDILIDEGAWWPPEPVDFDDKHYGWAYVVRLSAQISLLWHDVSSIDLPGWLESEPGILVDGWPQLDSNRREHAPLDDRGSDDL